MMWWAVLGVVAAAVVFNESMLRLMHWIEKNATKGKP